MDDRSDLTTSPSGLIVRERHISRRAVVGTAAWAAPTIVVATAVPAFAASGDAIARTSPVSPTFSASQTSTTQTLSVTVTNNGSPVVGRNIVFAASATNGGTTGWLNFSNSAVATDATGVATTTLQYGTPKPVAGSTYSITATDPSDLGLQVVWTLTYSPVATNVFTSDFNGIASGLPPKFSVRTGATSTALGTAAAVVASGAGVVLTPTSWNVGTGQFRNVASATGLTGAADSTAQANSSNRAIGLRQSGSYGNPGAAFVVEVGPTTGRSNLKVSFLLQSLDSSATGNVGQTTTFVVDGGTSTGTNFVGRVTATLSPVGVDMTTNGTFKSTLVTADFGSALDNLAGDVYVRIVTLAASTGSNNRPTSAIDDLTVSWI